MKILIITLTLAAAAIGGYLFLSDSAETPKEEATPASLTDADFIEADEYLCKDGKTIGTAFADGIIRITFSDKRVFTLEHVSSDDESGVKFANEGDQIVFWAKDDSAFLMEDGVEIYQACRVVTT